ncbi:unnamed protein product [Alternaria sp. RS040]
MAEKNKNPAARNVEAITRSNQLNSSLLRLPAELRNKIYFFTFDTNEVRLKSPVERVNPDFDCPPGISYPLGLVQSCTQCRYEALPYFWKTTVFQLRHGLFPSAWADLNSMVQTVFNQIQIIRFEADGMHFILFDRYRHSKFKKFTALRKILMQWPNEDTYFPEKFARRIFGKDIEICFYTD